MKQNEYQNISENILHTDLANIFHVYDEPKLGSKNSNLTYNINRTFSVIGIENISSELYTEYYTTASDTWTILAWKFYNDDRLWWIICKMNNIIDPTIQPEIGQKLYILNENYVRQILDQIKYN